MIKPKMKRKLFHQGGERESCCYKKEIIKVRKQIIFPLLLIGVFLCASFLSLFWGAEIAFCAEPGLTVTVTDPEGNPFPAGTRDSGTISIYERIIEHGQVNFKLVASDNLSYSSPTMSFSQVNVTAGKNYLVYVRGGIHKGLYSVGYSYVKLFTAPANLNLDNSNAVRVDTAFKSDLEDYSYHGSVMAFPVDPSTGQVFDELNVGVSSISSSGFAQNWPWLEKGTYLFAASGDRHAILSGPQKIESHYDEIEFDLTDASRFTINAVYRDTQETVLENPVRFIPLLDQRHFAFCRVAEATELMITPGNYNYAIEYRDYNSYVHVFHSDQPRSFSRGPVSGITVGDNLEINARIEESTLAPGEAINGEFSILDDAGLRLINVYEYPNLAYSYDSHYVSPELTLWDQHNNQVAHKEQSVNHVVGGGFEKSFSLDIPSSTEPGNYTLEVQVYCGAAGTLKKEFPVNIVAPDQGFRFNVAGASHEEKTIEWRLYHINPEPGIAYYDIGYGYVQSDSCYINLNQLPSGSRGLFLASVEIEGRDRGFYATLVDNQTTGNITFDYNESQDLSISAYGDSGNTVPLDGISTFVQPVLQGIEGASAYRQHVGFTDQAGKLNIKLQLDNGVDYRIIASQSARANQQAYLLTSPRLTAVDDMVTINTANSFSITCKPDLPLNYEVNPPEIRQEFPGGPKPAERAFHISGLSPDSSDGVIITTANEYDTRFSYMLDFGGNNNLIYSFYGSVFDFLTDQVYNIDSGRDFEFVDYDMDKKEVAPGEQVRVSYSVYDQYNNQLIKASFNDSRFRQYEKNPEIILKSENRVVHTETGNFNEAILNVPANVAPGQYEVLLLLAATEKGPVTASMPLTVSGDPLDPVDPSDPVIAVNLSANPPNFQVAGEEMIFKAEVTAGNPDAEFAFYYKTPGGKWTRARSYSTSSSWSISTTYIGPVEIGVIARAVGSSKSYEAIAMIDYEIVTAAPVKEVTLTADPAESQQAGEDITFTAEVTAGNPDAEFAFYYRIPGGKWTPARPYSTNPSWTVSTTYIGPVQIGVTARAVGSASSNEAQNMIDYEIY